MPKNISNQIMGLTSDHAVKAPRWETQNYHAPLSGLESTVTHCIAELDARNKIGIGYEKKLEQFLARGQTSHAAWIKMSGKYIEHMQDIITSCNQMLDMLSTVDSVAIGIHKQNLLGKYRHLGQLRLEMADKLLAVYRQALQLSLPEGGMHMLLADFFASNGAIDKADVLARIEQALEVSYAACELCEKYQGYHTSISDIPPLTPLEKILSSGKARSTQAETAASIAANLIGNKIVLANLLCCKADLLWGVQENAHPVSAAFLCVKAYSDRLFRLSNATFLSTQSQAITSPFAGYLFFEHPTSLSVDDQKRLLDSLSSQYTNIALGYTWLAQQCAEHGLNEEHLFKELVMLAQYLSHIAQSALRRLLGMEATWQSKGMHTTHESNAVVANIEPSDTLLHVIDTEFDGVIFGKLRSGETGVADVYSGQGQVLETYRYAPDRAVWLRDVSSQFVDTLADKSRMEMLAIGDGVMSAIQQGNGDFVQLTAQVECVLQEMAGRVKLARFLEKNNTVLPVYVEGCLKPYAEMLATHVSAFETLQDQLNLLSSEASNSVISPSGQHQAMTWAKKLRGHMAWVKHKAYDARVRMIKAQNPTEAGLRYLADKNGFAFEVTKIRARVPLLPPHITRQQREMGIFSADYLDEYQISFADGSPSWYAHFHYRHIGATLTEYSAAYLKNDAQRCLGHAWELDAVKQGRDVELYRGRISEELAQRLFFTKHTHNSRA